MTWTLGWPGSSVSSGVLFHLTLGRDELGMWQPWTYVPIADGAHGIYGGTWEVLFQNACFGTYGPKPTTWDYCWCVAGCSALKLVSVS